MILIIKLDIRVGNKSLQERRIYHKRKMQLLKELPDQQRQPNRLERLAAYHQAITKVEVEESLKYWRSQLKEENI